MNHLKAFAAGLVLAVSLSAQATFIAGSDDAYVDIMEAYMDAQAGNMSLLARRFGVAPGGSALSFSIQFNADYTHFSFSTAPGSAYGGSATALTVMGDYDIGSGLWNMSSSGQVGGQGFTGNGVLAAPPEHLGPGPKKGRSDWDFDFGDGGPIFDWHTVTNVFGLGDTYISDHAYRMTEDDVTVSFGTMRDRGTLGGPGWFWRTTSHVNLDAIKQTLENLWGMFGGQGEVDRATGLGQFELRNEVPEPATGWLAGLALALMVASARGRNGAGRG